MSFDEGLIAYSRKGRIQPFGTIADVTGHLLDKTGVLSGPAMDAAIREEFSEEMALRLVGKDPFSRFDDEPFTWDESEEPRQLDIGFFLYAEEIDWDAGTLRTDYLPGDGDIREFFFPDSELLYSELNKPDFEVEISGLSFEFSKIEMLLPTSSLGKTIGFLTVQPERRSPVGRPPKWDWEGAMAHVISKAQHPDGLPTGPGAQARIEGIITDWFMSELQDAPASSQVRQRASKIMRKLKTPNNN